MLFHRLAALCGVCFFLSSSPLWAQQEVLLQGKGRLARVDLTGKVAWEMPWGGIHDLHVLPNGHIIVQQGAAKVAEIDPVTKKVVWSYDSATQNGNAGKAVQVHAFQPLGDEHVMIVESGIGRIIEIDRAGKLIKEVKLKVNHPHPHTDTRLARKLADGHYLVCHEGDGTVREYSEAGQVIWEYEVPMFGKPAKGGHGADSWGNKCFAAVRLPNKNTLIATGNGHSVLEVTPGKDIVWKIEQQDLPGITLAWVTTLEHLPNGNYLIGNCHAGPMNPQLIELEPKSKKVVWTLNQFEAFGNDVSNSKVVATGQTTSR